MGVSSNFWYFPIFLSSIEWPELNKLVTHGWLSQAGIPYKCNTWLSSYINTAFLSATTHYSLPPVFILTRYLWVVPDILVCCVKWAMHIRGKHPLCLPFCVEKKWKAKKVLVCLCMHSEHFTIQTTQYTPYTASGTLHTAHCTLHTAQCTLHTTHYTLHTSHYTLHNTHHKLHNVQCTLHTKRYTLHNKHYTLHTKHYTIHTTHFTLHTIHYTLHTTHYTLNTTH